MILQKYLMFLGFSDTAFYLTDFAEKYFGFWNFYFNKVIYLMKIPFHEIRNLKIRVCNLQSQNLGSYQLI